MLNNKCATLLKFILIASVCSCTNIDVQNNNTAASIKTNVGIPDLKFLSIEALRNRSYGDSLTIEKTISGLPHQSYLASYSSDGLNLYSRIDLPITPMPEAGYPVVIFVHGWRGIETAPTLEFYYDPESYYHDMVGAYREAGFAVFVPGLRGHGTVNDVPAEGIEYMAAWDNGSYLSPIFYAIDVLNLIDSLSTFDKARLNLNNINLSGHSQGGDVVLTTLAVAGEGSSLQQNIHAASIWAGCIAPRFVQLETYAPMQKSTQAFVSGDGDWTGSAMGNNGVTNPHFIFPYPSDYIGTMNQAEWTWQNDSWSDQAVADVLRTKLDEMYSAINTHVTNINDASFELVASDNQATKIIHDPRVRSALNQVDAFSMEQYLTEPVALHHSDQDFYSLPAWNEDLCKRINNANGKCEDYTYIENTHSLRVSEHAWFSSENAIEGLPIALQRDTALFSGK